MDLGSLEFREWFESEIGTTVLRVALADQERKKKNLKRMQAWRAANPEKVRKTAHLARRRWRLRTPRAIRNSDKTREASRRWAAAHSDLAKARVRRWRLANPEKLRAITSRRRAAELHATPRWLTNQHWAEILQFYSDAVAAEKLTGKAYHVDHIVPLQGKLVCGLHVPWNLQVLPGADNISKGNRL